MSGGNVRRGMKYDEISSGNWQFVTDPSRADEQAKMLIMPSDHLSAKKLSLHFMCLTVLSFPFWEGYKDVCFTLQSKGWTPLNPWIVLCIFKTLNKLNASLGLDLCWSCHVLRQVLSVSLLQFLSTNWEKVGKLWRATWNQPAGRGLDSTGLHGAGP